MPQKAFLVGTHRYSYHAGEAAEILGVVFFTPPEKYDCIACYYVRFGNGDEDYIPLSDSKNFEIISEQYVLAGLIPEVTH